MRLFQSIPRLNGLKELKRDKQIRFSKGNLGDMIDQITARAQKKSRQKMSSISLFLLKIEIEIWNSFFDLIVKTKQEKKMSKFYLILKQKIEGPF